ncbi:MAG: metal ABC transporter substrate-binding protein [Spirochaetia bacterium]|nr:metal ABC transporter substrate-binding protein [Spirochaetia bacterium]
MNFRVNKTGVNEIKNNMLIKTVIFYTALFFLPGILSAEKLQIVTTTEDLKYFAEQIADNHAEVTSLVRGNEDPHFVLPRPDYIMKLNRADVFIQVGLDLEEGWAPGLIRQSKNKKIQLNAPGFCDASRGARILQIPQRRVSRLQGDIHAQGNPHYWTDPLNAVIAARNIRDTLIQIDSKNSDAYRKNFTNFSNRMKNLTLTLKRQYSAEGKFSVAVFHSEFIYLSNRFGFDIAVTLEEKPGVPPSASYLKKTVEIIKRKNIKVILISPSNNPRYAQTVARETGAKVILMPISVGSEDKIKTYEDSQKEMARRLLKDVK